MADNWTTTTLTAPDFQNAWNKPEEKKTISIIQGLLDGSIEPASAGRNITSIYHPRLLKGESISYYPFTLLSLAIIHPTTTFKNLEDMVQMLMHISKSPDMIVGGKPFQENGCTYWHDIPEFGFWFSQTALNVNTIEAMDLGHCHLTWYQQAHQYLLANTFNSLYLRALCPDLSPIEFKGTQREALICFSDALEVHTSALPQLRRAGLYVPAASQYFINSGAVIWGFCKSKQGFEGERVWKKWIGGSDGGNPLWTGEDGYSIQRWMFWKERLGDLAGLNRRGFTGKVIDGIVEHAKKAVEAMDKVEREVGDTLGGVLRLFGREE